MRSTGLGRGGRPECGTLSLTEDNIVFSAQNALEAAVASTTYTKISSIREIQLMHDKSDGKLGNHVCMVMVSGVEVVHQCMEYRF